MERNDPCWCGSQKKWKKCHFPLKIENNTLDLSQEYKKKHGILLKNEEQCAGIRHACQVTTQILEKTRLYAKAGVTTNDLNDFAHQLHKEAGAIPAPLGYGSPPFPKSICTSLNEVICHGIPDDTPLKPGDFLNIDISCIVNGYYGDCSCMVAIPPLDETKTHVMRISAECLAKALAILKPGIPIYAIGSAIEHHAEAHHCSVVNQFVGHGVGLAFHEPPTIPHHFNHSAILLVPGMIFTIEPMINSGVRSGVFDKKNQWTCRTKDGKPSAQWEHTVLITHSGYEILTQTGLPHGWDSFIVSS